MQHLCDITKKRRLADILALIQELSLLNGRWVVPCEAPPDNRPGNFSLHIILNLFRDPVPSCFLS